MTLACQPNFSKWKNKLISFKKQSIKNWLLWFTLLWSVCGEVCHVMTSSFFKHKSTFHFQKVYRPQNIFLMSRMITAMICWQTHQLKKRLSFFSASLSFYSDITIRLVWSLCKKRRQGFKLGRWGWQWIETIEMNQCFEIMFLSFQKKYSLRGKINTSHAHLVTTLKMSVFEARCPVLNFF